MELRVSQLTLREWPYLPMMIASTLGSPFGPALLAARRGKRVRSWVEVESGDRVLVWDEDTSNE